MKTLREELASCCTKKNPICYWQIETVMKLQTDIFLKAKAQSLVLLNNKLFLKQNTVLIGTHLQKIILKN